MNEALFDAESPEKGIVIIRLKRHLIDHFSYLDDKEKYLHFLDRFGGDDTIKCIIILGNPDKRGEGEFQEWLTKVKEDRHEPNAVQRAINALQQNVNRIHTLPQIVLYGDAGTMTTSYLSLGLASDYFVLGDEVRIQNPSAKHNLLPAGGVAHMMHKRLGRQRTLELLVSSEDILAKDLEEMGLCNCVCPAAELEEHLLRKARLFAQRSPTFLRSLKSAMRPDLKELESWFQHELHAIVHHVMYEENR